MGSKVLRKRNRDKVENEEQSVKHKNRIENKEEEQTVKHKDKVENKEEEQSVKYKKSKDHDYSKRRKACREDYHSLGHHEHIGQTSHDTSRTKTREDNQHTLTDNSKNKDRSHRSHNRGKSHEQHRDNRRKHDTFWRQEEFRNSTRAGDIRNERSTDWWSDRWCPEKPMPQRGDTKGMGLRTMNDNTFEQTFEHITTDWSLDRWCPKPERHEKEDQWPSYNKETDKMQKQQQSVNVHRHKGAAAMYEPSSCLFFLLPALHSCSAALRVKLL